MLASSTSRHTCVLGASVQGQQGRHQQVGPPAASDPGQPPGRGLEGARAEVVQCAERPPEQLQLLPLQGQLLAQLPRAPCQTPEQACEGTEAEPVVTCSSLA